MQYDNGFHTSYIAVHASCKHSCTLSGLTSGLMCRAGQTAAACEVRLQSVTWRDRWPSLLGHCNLDAVIWFVCLTPCPVCEIARGRGCLRRFCPLMQQESRKPANIHQQKAFRRLKLMAQHPQSERRFQRRPQTTAHFLMGNGGLKCGWHQQCQYVPVPENGLLPIPWATAHAQPVRPVSGTVWSELSLTK